MAEWVIGCFGWAWTIAAVLFTIAMTFLATKGAVNNGEASPALTAAFCSLFIWAGVWIIRTPARTRNRLARTVYAVTDRRAVVIEIGRWGTTVRSYHSADLGGLRCIDHPDGRGDVILSETQYYDSDGDLQTRRDGFMNIPDPRPIEALVRALVVQPEPGGVIDGP